MKSFEDKIEEMKSRKFEMRGIYSRLILAELEGDNLDGMDLLRLIEELYMMLPTEGEREPFKDWVKKVLKR